VKRYGARGVIELGAIGTRGALTSLERNGLLTVGPTVGVEVFRSVLQCIFFPKEAATGS
jgi:hypothetical protein